MPKPPAPRTCRRRKWPSTDAPRGGAVSDGGKGVLRLPSSLTGLRRGTVRALSAVSWSWTSIGVLPFVPFWQATRAGWGESRGESGGPLEYTRSRPSRGAFSERSGPTAEADRFARDHFSIFAVPTFLPFSMNTTDVYFPLSTETM